MSGVRTPHRPPHSPGNWRSLARNGPSRTYPAACVEQDAAGSSRLTITDQSGDGTTVALVGTPTIEAPDSLGAKVSGGER
jgi:hypothetical protein